MRRDQKPVRSPERRSGLPVPAPGSRAVLHRQPGAEALCGPHRRRLAVAATASLVPVAQILLCGLLRLGGLIGGDAAYAVALSTLAGPR